MKITPESFHRWKKDPVTEELYKRLQNLRTQLNDSLLNAGVILEEKKNAARLLGQREGLEVILNLVFDDFKEGEE